MQDVLVASAFQVRLVIFELISNNNKQTKIQLKYINNNNKRKENRHCATLKTDEK